GSGRRRPRHRARRKPPPGVRPPPVTLPDADLESFEPSRRARGGRRLPRPGIPPLRVAGPRLRRAGDGDAETPGRRLPRPLPPPSALPPGTARPGLPRPAALTCIAPGPPLYSTRCRPWRGGAQGSGRAPCPGSRPGAVRTTGARRRPPRDLSEHRAGRPPGRPGIRRGPRAPSRAGPAPHGAPSTTGTADHIHSLTTTTAAHERRIPLRPRSG